MADPLLGRNERERRTGGVVRLGAQRQPFADLYHYLVDSSWAGLFGAVLVAYVAANAGFAALYLAFGEIENARPGSFSDAFFFSVQTMATIGYGKMTPVGQVANGLVAAEALCGVVGFAAITSLLFAKFSRPTARVLFSRHPVINTRDGVTSLMFRVANERSSMIVEASIRVTLLRNEVTSEGERVRKLHDLRLVRSQTPSFALSWTVIHPVDETSPLHGATAEQVQAWNADLLVTLTGTEEALSQPVSARHTYFHDELRWDHRMVDVFTVLADGRRALDQTKFHDIEPVPPAP